MWELHSKSLSLKHALSPQRDDKMEVFVETLYAARIRGC